MRTETPRTPPASGVSGDGQADALPPLAEVAPPEPPRVIAPEAPGPEPLANEKAVSPTAAPPPAPEARIPIAKPASRRFRTTRAYLVALRIAASYLWFDAMARVRGPRWAARRKPALHTRNGKRLRRAIEKLRGLYIKAGQLASALTNFLPEAFRDELEGLQDQIPANDFSLVRERVMAELGAPPEALFEWVSPEPVASASLAQVHRARLGGRDVALKVQHADIEAIADLDLRAIRTILGWVGRWYKIKGLNAQMDEIEAVIRSELDFRQEAANVKAVGAALREASGVEVPTVIAERSARRVLTTEWVDAIKSSDFASLDARGLDRTALATRVLDAYGRMVFAEGAYHADPHPGNLLVRPDPEQPDGFALVFLDFGAVATLTPTMREGLAEMIAGTLASDAARTTAALGLMGFVPTASGASEVDAAVTSLIENIQAEVMQGIDPANFRLGDISFEQSLQQQQIAFDQMRELNVSIRDLASVFRVPRDWILLERTALLLVGLGTALDPDLNPFDPVWPYVEPLAGEAAPGVQRALKDRVVDELKAALTLPGRISRVLAEVEAG
ncbi:MAG: AarF/UbiB family protein, partial [Bacteroidota bacterium]